MNSQPTLTFNLGGDAVDLRHPAVMGIINVTPDSFYCGSRIAGEEAGRRAAEMAASGADIIDVGACSTRPGAEIPDADNEYERLAPALESIRRQCGNSVVISIDTFRSSVAKRCLNAFGPLVINDIGGTSLDSEIGAVAAAYSVPYVLTHLRGTPADMNSHTDYDDVVAEVISDLAFKADALHRIGVADIIIDPGFGFAKNVKQNYQLLEALPQFTAMGMPVLVGISRKSMIWRPLGITPNEAINGTTALNTLALWLGADIIRVHDVAQATEVRSLLQLFPHNS